MSALSDIAARLQINDTELDSALTALGLEEGSEVSSAADIAALKAEMDKQDALIAKLKDAVAAATAGSGTTTPPVTTPPVTGSESISVSPNTINAGSGSHILKVTGVGTSFVPGSAPFTFAAADGTSTDTSGVTPISQTVNSATDADVDVTAPSVAGSFSIVAAPGVFAVVTVV